ncbi:MAG: FAD-binding oxidoreductase [Candidatus Binataceae bacterium]
MKLTPLETELAGHGGAAVLEDKIDLLGYRRDTSIAPGGNPVAAMIARSVDDVVVAVATANRRKLPLYVRAAGSTYAGGANPCDGAIVLDVSALNRILKVDEDRGLVLIEPSVTYGALLAELGRRGLTLGVVPLTGAAGTVGGAIASHGLGTGSPRYQSTGDEVAGLEIVLPTGELMRTGSAALADAGFFARYAVGPDLTGMFLGASGCLGVITRIALWVHPKPEYQETFALGFPDYESGARFISALQLKDLTHNLWYGAGYEDKAIEARVMAARPQFDRATLPRFCLALDARGTSEEVARDRARIVAEGGRFGGAEFAVFDEIFFAKLRRDNSFWYSYAGYFGRSMCALLMCSMANENIPRFFSVIERHRRAYPQFIWAGGLVLCRRGVHGATIVFYDEREQWDEIRAASERCCRDLLSIGCVPYKSGRVWAPMMDQFGRYHTTLAKLKKTLDPNGIMSPQILGL